MEKSNLDYRNVVELRNGNKYLFYNEDFICLTDYGCLPLESYRKDLTDIDGDVEFDIIKVYKDYTLTELLWERKEKPKLTEDEKVILRNIDKCVKYIARNMDGSLFVYDDKPVKTRDHWDCEFHIYYFPFDHLFRLIEWEDEEPYSIEELLKNRHHIGKTKDNDFEIRNLAQMQETIKSSARTMSILLGAIASVSLLVGGIGIMNIMLVSVTERTKEIGIRMAIGARVSDIRWQFLIESFLLSMIGGLIGVVIGVLGSYLITVFAPSMTISISLFSIILALGFSGIVGVGFGYYPAYKASLLNPIDALRYE